MRPYKLQGERVVVAFQPHLYSRTRDLLAEFSSALAMADIVFVCPIYAAREEPIAGISAQAIVEKVVLHRDCDCRYAEDMSVLSVGIKMVATAGDCVILMGAGDIWKQCNVILSSLAYE